ncbi:MAG: hypothetical protein A3K68_03855 [Euryarchaeota archaeon RBG_16_68_13]|nr:MAG: hypothetical protein A3K68_03855 [Euryarchaeota archaeon RBG_16_68_13]
MNPRRVVAIARKSMSQFRHDKRTIGFVVGMPLLMIIAFGYTFGGQVSHVRTLVVNEDAGPLAGFLLENITGDSLDLEPFADLGSARAQVEGADAWAILYFPASFTADLARRNASIVVLLDGTNPPIVAAVLGTVRAAVEKTFAGSGGGTALTLDQEFVYGNADTRFIDSFAPGIVGLAVLLVTTVFSVIIIVREKSGGMLERLFATPLRPGELVLGHALSLGVIAFFQSLVVLGAALLLFQIQVVGSIGLAFAILLLFALGNQGLGMMLSAAARNELQAIQFIPAILFPSLLLTGVFFPLEAIPQALRGLSLAVPLTYAGDALRSVMLRGWGLLEVGGDLLALVAYAGLTLGGATLLIRRQA